MSEGRSFEEALQRSLGGINLLEDRYQFLRARADDRCVVVYFRYRDEAAVYAIELDVTPPLLGPSTGQPRSTIQDWAWEVRWLLDEEVGTQDLERRPRTLRDDGVVFV